MDDRLYRSRDDRMLAGVAGGVAERLDADPSIIRIVWAILVFLTGGLALLVYIVMAIVVRSVTGGCPAPTPRTEAGPAAGVASAPDPIPAGSWVAPDGSTVPQAASTSRRARRRRDPARPGAGRAGGRARADLVLGGLFLVREFLPSFDFDLWWPSLLVGFGILLVVLALVPGRHSDDTRSRTMARWRRSRRSLPSPAWGSSPGSPCSDAAWRASARSCPSPTPRPRRSRRSPPARSASAGVVEAAEVTLVSRLQSVPCVYYRAVVDGGNGDRPRRARRGAPWASASATTPASSGSSRAMPGSRPGPALAGPARPASSRPGWRCGRGGSARRRARPGIAGPARGSTSGRRTRATGWSRRRGPGRIGRHAWSRATWSRSSARPSPSATWATRPVPTWAWARALADDPEVAMDLAEATRRAPWRTIRPKAWGNAAIPGFGIGRPVRPRRLDPSADPLPLGDAADAARVERTFEIAPDTLVVAAVPDAPLLIAYGSPGRGHRAPGGPVPRRPARGGARDRVRDGVRGVLDGGFGS